MCKTNVYFVPMFCLFLEKKKIREEKNNKEGDLGDAREISAF